MDMFIFEMNGNLSKKSLCIEKFVFLKETDFLVYWSWLPERLQICRTLFFCRNSLQILEISKVSRSDIHNPKKKFFRYFIFICWYIEFFFIISSEQDNSSNPRSQVTALRGTIFNAMAFVSTVKNQMSVVSWETERYRHTGTHFGEPSIEWEDKALWGAYDLACPQMNLFCTEQPV